MSMTLETFKKVFKTHAPKDEGEWERSDAITSLKEVLEQHSGRLKQIRGDNLYKGDPQLATLLEEVDSMAMAVSQLEHRWKKMSSFLVKGALKDVGKEIHELKEKYKAAQPDMKTATEGDKDLCIYIEWGFENLDRVYAKAKDGLNGRKKEETGKRTGYSKGELIEGWNGINERYEYKHPDEWKRLDARDKLDLDWLFDEDFEKNRTTEMQKVGSGVHVQKDDGVSKERLETERKATALMRSGLTDNLKGRKGKAQEDVKNNSDMAQKLVSLVEKNPDLLDTDGLLSRIMGGIQGQGQFAVKDNGWSKEKDPVKKKQMQEEQNQTQRKESGTVIKSITEAAERLKAGKGEGEDGNKILQFISCFVDGLTEVTEGKQKPIEQLDKVWPLFQEAFGLTEDDKSNLLIRVLGYKEIAGGVADTLSGKGTRKDDTRAGLMPTDTDYKIEDEDALIKGDISGSMHSCLLAQELSESLLGREVETEDGEKVIEKPGLKQRGESVLVTDKGQLDARALDALALTAGGKIGENDIVLHTAYEMINGMRAISGAPKVSQSQATFVMAAMLKGETFTKAMESIFPSEKLPWLAGK
jgi:hypothetical protein